MKELLANYSLTEVIIILVLCAAALKEIVTFFDWAGIRLKGLFKKESRIDEVEAEIQQNADAIAKLTEIQAHTSQEIQKMNDMISLLVESDKDDIKAWITEKHHYFCYEKRHIDDYSLDCIEKRFGHYEKEGGNSFVHNLMEELRTLPKTSSEDK